MYPIGRASPRHDVRSAAVCRHAHRKPVTTSTKGRLVRYRDQPTVEVTQVVPCDADVAWRYVTDIELPVRNSAELKHVEWLDGADHIEVGARFRGYNRHDAFGEWQTVCEVAEVEPGRRWTWNVHGAEGITATWVSKSSRPARAPSCVSGRGWARGLRD
ncbi:SRPBCC family protein [Mycolicibacterium setense]|uniref:SRPBCC family protein n=1 Tax=Mycolicibacterium setense TaxID=431269 RepID=UPI001F328449|nr:SRPBCC family protein [Mycolicibacterium setense]